MKRSFSTRKQQLANNPRMAVPTIILFPSSDSILQDLQTERAATAASIDQLRDMPCSYKITGIQLGGVTNLQGVG